MRAALENKVTALRYLNDGEQDAFVLVEVGDETYERGIDLHIDPRTDDVVTISLSPREAWQLAQELARAATVHESP